MASSQTKLWTALARRTLSLFVIFIPTAYYLFSITPLRGAPLAVHSAKAGQETHLDRESITPITPSYPILSSPQGPQLALSPEAAEFAQIVFQAAREGDEDFLRQALNAGLPVELMNEKGNTLLMLAAYSGHPSLVRLLLLHGADPNRLNDRNQSPLGAAVFKLEKETVQALLDGGADVWAGKPNAAELAGMVGSKEMLAMLRIEGNGIQGLV